MAHNDTHAARKKGGAGKILLVVLLLLLLAAGAAVRFAYNEIHGNGAPGSTEVTVSIPQGSGVAAIANKLKEAGVIRSAYLFRWYVGEKGAAAKLQYGDFVLQTSAISYDAIIATLSQYAKAETVRVTIPEGTTAIAIAQKMESAGLCTAEEFLITIWHFHFRNLDSKKIILYHIKSNSFITLCCREHSFIGIEIIQETCHRFRILCIGIDSNHNTILHRTCNASFTLGVNIGSKAGQSQPVSIITDVLTCHNKRGRTTAKGAIYISLLFRRNFFSSNGECFLFH